MVDFTRIFANQMTKPPCSHLWGKASQFHIYIQFLNTCVSYCLNNRFSIVKAFVGAFSKVKFREVPLKALVSQLPGDHGSGAHIPVVVGDCILGAPGEDVPCQYQPGQDSQRRHLCGSWRGGTERRVNKGRGDYWELIPFPLTISWAAM